MKEMTRYRVTGTIVLVSLATIFLPMLFDGDGLEPEVVKSLNSDGVELRPVSYTHLTLPTKA